MRAHSRLHSVKGVVRDLANMFRLGALYCHSLTSKMSIRNCWSFGSKMNEKMSSGRPGQGICDTGKVLCDPVKVLCDPVKVLCDPVKV